MWACKVKFLCLQCLPVVYLVISGDAFPLPSASTQFVFLALPSSFPKYMINSN